MALICHKRWGWGQKYQGRGHQERLLKRKKCHEAFIRLLILTQQLRAWSLPWSLRGVNQQGWGATFRPEWAKRQKNEAVWWLGRWAARFTAQNKWQASWEGGDLPPCGWLRNGGPPSLPSSISPQINSKLIVYPASAVLHPINACPSLSELVCLWLCQTEVTLPPESD